MSDIFLFECPNCGGRVKAKKSDIGKVGTCRSCEQKVKIRPAAAEENPPGPPKKPGEIPWGVAGLILVALGLLRFAYLASSVLLFWYLGSIGVLASFIGLIVSIVGICKNSGRMAGVLGLLAYGLLAALFVVLKI